MRSCCNALWLCEEWYHGCAQGQDKKPYLFRALGLGREAPQEPCRVPARVQQAVYKQAVNMDHQQKPGTAFHRKACVFFARFQLAEWGATCPVATAQNPPHRFNCPGVNHMWELRAKKQVTTQSVVRNLTLDLTWATSEHHEGTIPTCFTGQRSLSPELCTTEQAATPRYPHDRIRANAM